MSNLLIVGNVLGFDGILRSSSRIFFLEGSTVRQPFARGSWLVTGFFASAILLVARPAAPQFTRFSHNPRNVLEGHWQSCREPDGRYSERVYDHVVNGEGKFEVHMGPRREFAIFPGVQDEHRDHQSPENLLKPYIVVMEAGRAKKRWELPSLNLAFTVALAGGSRTDCESWFILLEPLEKTSH
jgi:hypothetical protein